MGKPTEAVTPLADNARPEAVQLTTNSEASNGAGGSTGGSNSHPPIDNTEYGFPPRARDNNDDDDDDELPPLYTDIAESSALLPPSAALPMSSVAPDHSLVQAFKVNQFTGTEYYMSHELESDPSYLEQHVLAWSRKPPRTYIQVRGTHTETKSEQNRSNTTSNTVVDFSVRVDMTPYLYTDVIRGTSSWANVRTVEDHEKARRGTVFKYRAPGARSRQRRRGGVRLEDDPRQKPTLTEWCHRFCASSGGLKVFALQKQVVGIDKNLLIERLHSLVRSTNYRGHVSISFPTDGGWVEVYNECKVNEWRFKDWLIPLVTFTLTFIFTVPYLFFRTKRFEAVFVDWPFSRPARDGSTQREFVSLNEDQLYGLWGAAIRTAVINRRQCVLDQQDLVNSHAQNQGEQPGGIHGLVAAGIQAMNVVNHQFGWGSNT